MSTRNLLRAVVPAAVGCAVLASTASPASATIHPIIQSINCAAAAAFAQAPVADPPGQTPSGLTAELFSVEGTVLRVSFPEPLEFDQSDFRALIATGFVDEVVMNADGMVTALLVDLTSIPNAVRGQGGAHCANA